MKKRIVALDIMLVVLSISCIALGIALAVVKPVFLIPVAVLMLLVFLGVYLNIRLFRRKMTKLLHGTQTTETQAGYAALKIPVLVLSGGRIAWYNDAFRDDLLGGEDTMLLPVGKVLPGFMCELAKEKNGQNFEFGSRRYTVYGSGVEIGDGLFVAYFVDNTQLKRQAGEYLATRPSVLMIALDTYDEILKELKESERTRIIGAVENALDQFIGTTTGFLRRVSTSRYLAVVEERHMHEIVQNRFSILDTVRGIGDENAAVTLSIGVGRLAPTLQEGYEMAVQALDMALGRGGDQAAVKSKEGFDFYGGVSRSVEKRSKVKSRIIAAALKDLIAQSSDVLIMGHKSSDLDAVGASIGMLRFCRICRKPACIVVNEERSLAANLIEEFRKAGRGTDFISPDDAVDAMDPNTLVIIVDTHVKYLLECAPLYERAKNVVVIDHHRKCVGHIDNSVIFYHEPYASSASELVSELLQYLDTDKENRLQPLEAQALLAGIMLDTRNFALHTGVRTFEAAAYLRRMGAQTQEVKKLFNSSFEDYAYKAQLVTDAEIYMGCAVVFADNLPEEMSVVIPQAANDLLTINGVQASFVAVDTGTQITISARSMGEVNVQVIMEALGGGGHLTMAGAQLKNCTLEDAKHRLLDAIADYRENRRKAEAMKNNTNGK